MGAINHPQMVVIYASRPKTMLIKGTFLLACVRRSWRGGVGWGGHVNVPCTSSATCCHAAQMSALKRKKGKTCQHAPMKWIQSPHEMRFVPNSRARIWHNSACRNVCFSVAKMFFFGKPLFLRARFPVRRVVYGIVFPALESSLNMSLYRDLVSSSKGSVSTACDVLTAFLAWRQLARSRISCYRHCEKVLSSEIWWAFPEIIPACLEILSEILAQQYLVRRSFAKASQALVNWFSQGLFTCI